MFLFVKGPVLHSEEIPPPQETQDQKINNPESQDNNEETTNENGVENSVENNVKIEETTQPEIEASQATPTHHLTMNINGMVQIFNDSDSSFNEEEKFKVTYELKLEDDIAINAEKNTTSLSTSVKITTSGFISSGEGFSCLTEINTKDLVFNTSTEIKKKKETNTFILGLKLSEESAQEKWIFICNTDSSTESLSSEGGFENYLWQIITEAKPALKSLVFKKFDPTEIIKLDIPIKPLKITEEGLEPAQLSGAINLEITPL